MNRYGTLREQALKSRFLFYAYDCPIVTECLVGTDAAREKFCYHF